MPIHKEQMTLGDISPEYQAFVDKFKQKKTTDDCYTPEGIYNVVINWVVQEYRLPEGTPICRPFYPGGDYESYDYPEGCVVVDNPPFSIIKKIIDFYDRHNIRYFLFAPMLTSFGKGKSCAVICDAAIIYENGASVKTSFLTNMEKGLVARSAPDLTELLKAEIKEIAKKQKKQLPRYEYPPEVITATVLEMLARYGVEFEIPRNEAQLIRRMDAQRDAGKAVFGSGYLVSPEVAWDRLEAEETARENKAKKEHEEKPVIIWELSEREKDICRRLGT